MLVNNTPVQKHAVSDSSSRWHEVFIKREDLCCPTGPPFSKMRGVYAHLQKCPEALIGVLDTYHSKAGWAVARAAQDLGKEVINFYPRYKSDDATTIRYPQIKSQESGAYLHSLPAGRSAVLYHQAKKLLLGVYSQNWKTSGYMMPNALKLPESITENEAEAIRTLPHLPESGTVIISISSGTVAAGVTRGLVSTGRPYHFMYCLGYSRSTYMVRRYMEVAANINLSRHEFIDEGYAYKDEARHKIEAPFPCNPYYDLKAWQWVVRNIDLIRGPVIFWNVGD